MAERCHIGEHQLLLGYVDIVYVRTVDDKALSDADEVVALITQLVSNHLLNLSQLEREHAHFAIGLHEGRIVAVGRDVDDTIGCYAHQVYRGGKNQLSLR